MVPFIIRYCRPEAVNDNDARARRGEEGQAGRDEPRRAWQGQKCTVAVAADAVGVDAGLDLVGPFLELWTFDLLTVGLFGPGRGLSGAAGRKKWRFRTRNFERGRTAATLPTAVSPQKKYGAENIGPVGLGGDWAWGTGTWDWDDWDWTLLGSAWMEEAHLTPKGERRTKQDGRGRNEREGMGRHRVSQSVVSQAG